MENSKLEEISFLDTCLFKYKVDNNVVGFILTKKDSSEFYFEVFDIYRGNGYGKTLFLEVLNIFKGYHISKFSLCVNIENFRMINILENYNALLLSNNNGVKEYLIRV